MPHLPPSRVYQRHVQVSRAEVQAIKDVLKDLSTVDFDARDRVRAWMHAEDSLMQMEHDLNPECTCDLCIAVNEIKGKYE